MFTAHSFPDALWERRWLWSHRCSIAAFCLRLYLKEDLTLTPSHINVLFCYGSENTEQTLSASKTRTNMTKIFSLFIFRLWSLLVVWLSGKLCILKLVEYRLLLLFCQNWTVCVDDFNCCWWLNEWMNEWSTPFFLSNKAFSFCIFELLFCLSEIINW